MVIARKVKESEITEQDPLLQVAALESEKKLLTLSSATAEVEMTEVLDSPPSETGEEEETRESVIDIDPPTRKIAKKYPKPYDKVPRSTTRMIKDNSARAPNEATIWNTALTVAVLIAGGSYAALVSIHNLYPVLAANQGKIVHLGIHDLFTYPSAIVDGFVLFTTITIAYISAIIVMLVAVCMICRKLKWGTAVSVFAFLAITTMLVSFCSTLNKVNPSVVRIDGLKAELPGGYVLVFYSVYVIIIAGTMSLIAQSIVEFCSRRVKVQHA